MKFNPLVEVPLPGAPAIDFQSQTAYQIYAALILSALFIFLVKKYTALALVLLGIAIAIFAYTFLV